MPPAAPDLRDIKPLVTFPHGVAWLWWALVVLAVLVALGVAVLAFRWWRRRRAAASLATCPPEPPDRVALVALQTLFADFTVGRIEAQAYFYGLSAILRTYVEARFGVNATDLTTSEIRARLHAGTALDVAQVSVLIELLEAADTVKYARAEAHQAMCAEARQRACSFIEATRPVAVGAGERGGAGSGIRGGDAAGASVNER